jgi:hypothetical protein
LTTFDVKGSPVTNGAPKEFYLLVGVVFDAVYILNLAGSFCADLLLISWELYGSAALGVHDFHSNMLFY